MRKHTDLSDWTLCEYVAPMRILTPKDGGRIRLVKSGAGTVDLAVRADPGRFRQWFSFVLEDEAREARTIRIVNAGACAYPEGFAEGCVSASFDGERWTRVRAELDGGVLSIRHEPRGPRTHYAWFEPYTARRRHDRLVAIDRRRGARVREIGKSVLGTALNVIVVGAGGGPTIWVIARQHAGESMAEWAAEGLVDRLLDDDDDIAATLRERARIHIVPCVDVDGATLGHHRVNSAGRDLDRAWLDADDEETPEVVALRRTMDDAGVDMFLDLHGNESSRVGFLEGCEGNRNHGERLGDLEGLFGRILSDASDDMGPDRDDPLDESDDDAPPTAARWVGETYDCLSLRVELPAKGAFTAERAMAVGRDLLEPVLACLEASG